MAATEQQTAAAPRGGSLLLLLVSLLLALLVSPVMEDAYNNRVFVYIGVTGVLVLGVFVNRWANRLFLPCLVLSVLAMLATWSTLVVDYPAVFVASCLLEATFYATIAGILLVAVLRKHLATVGSIFGALCVYLLLGLSWAQLYWATERIDAESLLIVNRVTDIAADGDPVAPFSQMVYFSFVTMSTLGYGDIVPETSLARTLAWMQSVLGQFYLAVLVAWIVSALPRQVPRIGLPQTEADEENER